ncbi:INO80 complex subunit 1 [Erysiphe necator]|uniref:Putative zinc finger protein n=1 Tax=Uncinula necator TaxID=52586 RepID=A0A0B1P6Q3_UNCNE|nr:INO80 complex subunit 1 [Erysiphe necator]KHJ32621.1 putative zinc finger protein [Erysiphe necator]
MRSKSPALSGSPLSIISSDTFLEDSVVTSAMPSAKRQKIEQTSLEHMTPPKFQDDVSISSDSSADIPHSPTHQRGEEDEIHEQVTVCRWADCDAGDLVNMDNLVAHIHEDHVETRSKKYICEWNDCGRKNMPHASAYALKAHMRSHTKEKPFYCELPECDRSFTRSDALQKHYRTVHETEALRPSDPIPKSMQTANKSSKQKSASKFAQTNPEEISQIRVNGIPNKTPSSKHKYPSEFGFTSEEEIQKPKDLYRLLRRQVHWAEEEADYLNKFCDTLEELRRQEWIDKEILLDQALKTDIDWQKRRQIVLASEQSEK